MTQEARVRINTNRMMRAAPTELVPVYTQGEPLTSTSRSYKPVCAHIGAFMTAFIFAVGFASIGFVLFVHSSEDIFPLVMLALFSAVIFVVAFAVVRMLILYTTVGVLLHEDDDDSHVHHHIAKSIAYGLVALSLALLIAGFVMYTASAFAVS